MPYREFNLKQAAAYLHISPEDLEQLVRENRIPHHKSGSHVVFRKSEIDAWMSEKILGLPRGQLSSYHKRTSVKTHEISQKHAIIPELMKPHYIEPALAARTKASVLREMVSLAEKTGLVIDPPGLLDTLEARERMSSTALEGGVALLHPHHPQPYLVEDSFLVLARSVQAIPFGAPDGRTTDIFFLVCTQQDELHLHVLARLCMMCHTTSLLLELREAKDRQAMYDALLRSEGEVIESLHRK